MTGLDQKRRTNTSEPLLRRSLWLALAVGLANGLVAALCALWTDNPLLGSWYFVLEFSLRWLARFLPEWWASSLGSVGGVVSLFGLLGLVTGVGNFLLLLPCSRFVGRGRRLLGAHLGLAVFDLVFAYGLVSTFDVGFSHAELTPLGLRMILGVVVLAVGMALLVARLATLGGGTGDGGGFGSRGRKLTSALIALVMLPGLVSMFGERSRRGADADRVYRPPPGRVILLGIDGFERDLAEELMAVGRMPNLARAIGDGAMGPLRTIIPYYSPVVWTSVATGKRPPKHGVTGFVDAETHNADLLDRRDIRSAALWDITAARRVRAGYVNWYYTWPAIIPEDGYMVSDRLVYGDLPFRAAPDAIIAAVDSTVVASVDAFPMSNFVTLEYDSGYQRYARNTPEYERHHFHMVLERSIHRDVASIRTAVLLERNAERPAELLTVYIRATDAAGHIHWKHHVARENPAIGRLLWDVTDDDAARFGGAIREYYAVVDQLIGEILSLADENTTLIICSDHGYGFNLAGGRVVKLNRLLRDLGFLRFGEGGDQDVDWGRTEFFDNPNNLRIASTRRISANLEGREMQGAVRPEENRRRAPELLEQLMALETTDGVPVFTGGVLAELDGGVDLVVDLNRSIPLDGTVDLGSGRMMPVSEFAVNFRISGMHRMDATLVLSGPAAREGVTIRSAGVLDIAPTVLHLLGQPVARDMDGRVLTELLAGEAAGRAPVYVDSYDPERLETDDEAASDSEVDQVIKDQLRTLGYIQ